MNHLALPLRKNMFLGVMAAAAALLSVVSFGPQQASAADTGRVRVMHASPDTPAVDIFVDGAKAVTALAFPNNTGYVSLPAGGHNVKVFVSPSDGTGAPALEANLDVAAGKDYTVLAVGELAKSSIALLPLEDNNATPAAGKAHVRLIHAAPDAPPVNVAVSGTTTNVFTGVAYRNIGNYTPVDAGTYSLDVKINASGATALTVPGVNLEARTVYSAVAVGLAGNGTLRVIPLVDAAAPAAAAPAAAQPVAPASPAAPSTGNTFSATAGGGQTTLIAVGALLVVLSGAVAVSSRRFNR